MTPNKPKDKWIHVRVDAKTHREFSKVVRPFSVSDTVRKLIDRFIKESGK